MDKCALRRVAGEALRENVTVRLYSDDVLHLDVEIIGGQRQARYKPRLYDHAGRKAVGLFWAQIGIATEKPVVLVGRVPNDRVSVLRSGHRSQLALRQGCRRRSTTGARRARIRCSGQRYTLGKEQLDNVRSANSTIVAAAETDVADWSEFDPDFVGARAEGVVCNFVAGVTIPSAKLQKIDEIVFNDRDLSLGKELANIERTLN